MDVLVELIIWLFKALAGDDEQRKRAARGQPPVARGPYNYGDGRPPPRGNASAPRTLEEILDEVKRSQQSRAQVSAPRKIAAAAEPNKIVAVSQRDRPPAPPPDSRLIARTLEFKESVKPQAIEKKFDRLKVREDARFRPLSEQSEAQGEPSLQQISEVSVVTEIQDAAHTPVKAITVYREFFKTLKSAPLQSRREMARNAIVFSEVFGPPKALRRGRRR